jgi:hypothetical protein
MDGDSFIQQLSSHFGQDELEDSVVNFHKEFASSYGDHYLQLVKKVEPALEEVPVHNPFFNDHGRRHSYRIILNLSILTDNSDHQLSPTERYVLASCAWLHDIGMSINEKIDLNNVLSETLEDIPDWFSEIGTTEDEVETIDDAELIRKWHHILSWNFVRENRERLGFPNFKIADTVADVCRVHREGIAIDDLDNRNTIRINSTRGDVNTRAIAALFQFADALDVTRERAPKISSDVLHLPSESEPHWRTNQLINDFDYDLENRVITLEASHTEEKDKDLLKDIVAELYSEYRDVEADLVSEPYPFSLADIQCETTHRESIGSGGTTVLSGKDEYINNIKIEGREKKREQSSDFIELRNEWCFEICNEAGDARISRRMEIELCDDNFTERTHFVRSFDSTYERDWASEITAYEEDGKPLSVEVEIDRPNHKRFDVMFPEQLRTGDVFCYGYEYEWDEFFPKNNEEFVITGNDPEPAFELVLPETLALKEIWWDEVDPEDNHIVRTERPDDHPDDRFRIDIEKAQKNNNVAIHWIQQ